MWDWLAPSIPASARAILRQHLFQRRTGMARLDTPEGGQLAKIQKWVVHSIRFYQTRAPHPGWAAVPRANTYHASACNLSEETTRGGLGIRSHQRRRRQRRSGLRAARGRIRRQGCRDRAAPLGGHLRERGLRPQESHVERGGRRVESRAMRTTTASMSRRAATIGRCSKRKRDAYVLRLNGIYERNLEAKGVAYVRGAARFLDAHTLEVNGQRMSAQHIVIATGGKAVGPESAGRRARHHLGRFFRARGAPAARRRRRQRLHRLRIGQRLPRTRQPGGTVHPQGSTADGISMRCSASP